MLWFTITTAETAMRPSFPLSVFRSVAAIALSLAAFGAQAANRDNRSLQIGGEPRSYIVVSPDQAAAGPLPTVLLFHGHIGTAENALGDGRMPSPLSAWVDLVDREKVLVVALQGLKGPDGYTGWHDCRSDAVGTTKADDVAFTNAVVADLVRSGRADPRRLYVMGMSNGAMMAFRLAQEMQPQPIAITAVSGTMAMRSECRPPKLRVSVLIIQGTSDPLVPFLGGIISAKGKNTGTVTGAIASRDWWLKADRLENAPLQKSRYAHHPASTDTSATRETWGEDAGPQVSLITVDNGGHIEPSLRFHAGWLYTKLVGKQNQDFESAEEAWAFFKPKSR